MMKTLMMTAIAASAVASVPAAAGPGIVFQGPSVTGIAPLEGNGGGASCPTWRCGFNGVSTNGIKSNGFTLNGITFNGLRMNGLTLNGWTLNGLTWNGLVLNGWSLNGSSASGGAPGSFTATVVTLPGGEVLPID